MLNPEKFLVVASRLQKRLARDLDASPGGGVMLGNELHFTAECREEYLRDLVDLVELVRNAKVLNLAAA